MLLPPPADSGDVLPDIADLVGGASAGQAAEDALSEDDSDAAFAARHALLEAQEHAKFQTLAGVAPLLGAVLQELARVFWGTGCWLFPSAMSASRGGVFVLKGLNRSTSHQTWAGRLLLAVVLQCLAGIVLWVPHGKEAKWLLEIRGLEGAARHNRSACRKPACRSGPCLWVATWRSPAKWLHTTDAVKGWVLLREGEMTCTVAGLDMTRRLNLT